MCIRDSITFFWFLWFYFWPEVKSEEPEESDVKEETIDPEVKSIKPKKRTVKDEIIDVEVDSDNNNK